MIIKFADLINTPDNSKAKIKFNISSGTGGEPALDNLYNDEKNDEWITMNAWRGADSDKQNKLDGYKYLVAMAKYYPYGDNFYMFGGVYEINPIMPAPVSKVGYQLKLLNNGSEYRKRLIVKLDEPIGQSYNRVYQNYISSHCLEVYEIIPAAKFGSFNGYSNVFLTHKELNAIINEDAEWKKALSYIKAVYVITDRKTGKLYVGSAYGEGGLWGRWYGYADFDNLTNGNKDFESIIQKEGAEYIKNNFTYSILEIFDKKTRDEDIIRREHYWMNVLDSINHGMNN